MVMMIFLKLREMRGNLYHSLSLSYARMSPVVDMRSLLPAELASANAQCNYISQEQPIVTYVDASWAKRDCSEFLMLPVSSALHYNLLGTCGRHRAMERSKLTKLQDSIS